MNAPSQFPMPSQDELRAMRNDQFRYFLLMYAHAVAGDKLRTAIIWALEKEPMPTVRDRFNEVIRIETVSNPLIHDQYLAFVMVGRVGGIAGSA
jgi:hypothetical protein